MPDFKIQVVSGELAVRNALQQILDGLSALALDPEETGSIELVLAEALNNVVEHAYPPQDPAGPIRVQCGQAQDGLHFRIEDFGRKMPDGKMPLGEAQDLDVPVDDLPEGGFGWFLIQNIAKDVCYRREAGRNILSLRIAVVPTG